MSAMRKTAVRYFMASVRVSAEKTNSKPVTRAPKSEVAKKITSRERLMFRMTLRMSVVVDMTIALSVTTWVIRLCATFSIRQRLNLPP